MNSVKYLDTLYKELQSVYPEVAAEIAKASSDIFKISENSPEKFILALNKNIKNFSLHADKINVSIARKIIGGGQE